MCCSVCTSLCVCNTFTVYTITQKNTVAINSNFFVDTLGTFGQHGFCGCIGVEISRARGLAALVLSK